MTPTISIVVPVYNEEKTISALLNRVLALNEPPSKEIIVVDDGSTDGTAVGLTEFKGRITIETHARNRGKGAAVRTGYAKARGDYVVVQDGDLEYDPNDILRMYEYARKHNAPVVFGSRYMESPDGKVQRGKWYFYLGGRLVTLVANALYGTRLTDEPTCYKMVRRDILEKISLTCEGFEFCPEITAKISRLGIPIVEIPIHYAPRSSSEGKKIKLRDGVFAIWTLLKYRLGSIR